MKLSCAGKVFITGEYSCIEGGPSLLGTVGPAFSLDVDRMKGNHALPFAEGSPAGLFLKAHASVFKDIRLNWRDPYESPIGVGSSSAQFILSVAAVALLQDKPLPSASEVLELYWQTVVDTQGLRPSGADVVAQWIGGPVIVRNRPFTGRKLEPLETRNNDVVFLLAYTGQKAKTHEHLLKLKEQGFPDAFSEAFGQLNEVTLEAIAAWEAANAKNLGKALNAYQETLLSAGLATQNFTEQLREIQSWPGVLGCKGSGAQGGDCVLILVESNSCASVMARLQYLKWVPSKIHWSHSGVTSLATLMRPPAFLPTLPHE